MSSRGGSIWQAAKRGEGYQLARESNITWVLVFLISIVAFAFRFVSGRPLAGDSGRKTNATWTLPGRELLHPKERPPFGWPNPHGFCWSRLSERKRAAIRMGILLVVVAFFWDIWDGLVFDGSIFHNAVTMAAMVVACRGLYLLYRKVNGYTKDRKTRRDVINPLKEALAPYFGTNNPADVKLTLYPTQPAEKS